MRNIGHKKESASFNRWCLNFASLCNLRVLCVSVVSDCGAFFHHGGTENTKVAQRRSQTKTLPFNL